uniref:BolA family member 2 n=1 Tax=Periophthalmus magnuspinnatus TaxID=409849 RepID=A0A3B3ZKQ9_9GOBI
MAITAEHIQDKLIKELAAVHVDVEDTSPNRCAASYKVLVVSAQFEGKPLLQRHRYYGRRTLHQCHIVKA